MYDEVGSSQNIFKSPEEIPMHIYGKRFCK